MPPRRALPLPPTCRALPLPGVMLPELHAASTVAPASRRTARTRQTRGATLSAMRQAQQPLWQQRLWRPRPLQRASVSGHSGCASCGSILRREPRTTFGAYVVAWPARQPVPDRAREGGEGEGEGEGERAGTSGASAAQDSCDRAEAHDEKAERICNFGGGGSRR